MPHDHEFQLDLDGQITCVICGTMGPIPTPESIFESQIDFE